MNASVSTAPDPPTRDQDQNLSLSEQDQALIQLSTLPGLGPRTLASLLQRWPDPRQVLVADESELAAVPGVGTKMIHTIRTAAHHSSVPAIIDWCEHHRVQIICRDHENYPRSFAELADAPPVLFVQGRWLESDELSVAVVGTRHATAYGRKLAERFGYQLARAGVTVVSGLARGIDAAAHRGALQAGGRTVAILGGGLAHLYPREHLQLAGQIEANGAVITEYAPQSKPRSGMFPQRNRLIAALSLGTLVIEAPDRSGALITARLAGEQNRDVFALPGPVTSPASRGCNQLIRDGAVLVQTVEDLLDHLGPISQPIADESGRKVRRASELNLNDLERQILDVIDETSTSIDEVIQRSQISAQRVMATISVLEMRRLVRRLSGQYVARM